MQTSAAALIAAAALVASAALTAAVEAREGDPFALDRCAASVRDEPDGSWGYRCYWALSRRGQRDVAVRALEALVGFEPNRAKALYYLAHIARDQGSDKALDLYRRSAAAYADRGDLRGQASVLLVLAEELRIRNRMDEAEATLEEGLALARETGDREFLASSQCAQARFLQNLGDYGAALSVLHEAEAQAFPDGSTRIKLRVLEDLALVYARLERFAEALDCRRRKMALVDEPRVSYEGAAQNYWITLLSAELGLDTGQMSHEEYVESLEDALDLAIEAGHRGLEATIRRALGRQLDGPRAIEELRLSIEISRSMRNENRVRTAQRTLAVALARESPDRRDEALSLMSEAIESARESRDMGEIANALLVNTELYSPVEHREEWMDASRLAIDAAEDLLDRQPESSVRARTLHRRARPYLRYSGLLLASLDASPDPEGDLDLSFRTMEAVRSRVLIEELELAGIGTKAERDESIQRQLDEVAHEIARIQRELADPALQGEARQAKLAELTRAEQRERALRDRLARSPRESASRDESTGSPQDRTSEDQQAGSSQDTTSGDQHAGSSQGSSLRERPDGSPQEGAVRDPLAGSLQEGAPTHTRAVPSLREIQESMAPDQAILAFQLSHRRRLPVRRTDNGGSWLLSITRDDVAAYPLEDRVPLNRRLRMFLGLCRRGDGSEGEAAAALYDELLGEALRAAGPGIRRLIVVPFGALHRFPFTALRPEPDGEPLGALYQIVQVPSVSLWFDRPGTAKSAKDAESAAPATSAETETAALPAETPETAKTGEITKVAKDTEAAKTAEAANTEESEARSLAALALADPELLVRGEGEAVRAADPWIEGLQLGPLPRARAEAEELTQRIGGASRVLAGADATERFLKRADLSDYGILHLATHAVVDNDRPERSSVLLGPGADDEDGFLQAREIAELDLKGKVVILSSCRSASGPVLAGEGVLGLARAFFRAGARTVIGNLWPMRDEDAEAFVRELSRGIARGDTLAAAMRSARQRRIAAGAPAAAWAGVVLLGDGDYAPLAEGSASPAWPRWLVLPSRALWLALLITAIYVGLAIRSRRRRRSTGRPESSGAKS